MMKWEEWCFRKVKGYDLCKGYIMKCTADEQAAIKKRIRYNAENRTWTLGNEAWGTFPKIFWYYPTSDR